MALILILMRICRVAGACAIFIVLAACAEPPNKEMDQAQGAIDAARAAGAEQYAPAELTAAIDALKKAHEAVAQRDYRLALNHAIDSREQAQAAAKTAVEVRVKARGDAERLIAELAGVLTHARERLRDPDVQRAPRRALTTARSAVDAGDKALQEARAALSTEDYPRAIKATQRVAARVQTALKEVDEAAAPPKARPRR